MKDIPFSYLYGKIIKSVEGLEVGSREVKFILSDGVFHGICIMDHYQECCEDVHITDITGDVNDIVGARIQKAEEVTHIDENAQESGTWTFYKLATVKGYVDIRWYGSSNGYYSETVNFRLI